MQPAPRTDPLLKTVRSTLHTEKMYIPEACILVAVSGGPDSVCLLHALWSLAEAGNFRVCVAHLNHCLRGAESDADEAFVVRLAKDMDIPYKTGRINIGGADKPGSLEDRARQARYNFLQKAALQLTAHKIATGHTVDDQAETVLMRLLRGTGTSGLAGIHPVRKDGIIRPLLAVTRNEVMAYIALHQLPYRTDSSNKSDDYFRNRIRHKLLPYIKSNFKADVHRRLATTAAIVGKDEAWFEDAVTLCFTKALKKKGKYTIILDIQKMRTYNNSVINRIIRRSLDLLATVRNGASFEHIHSVCTALKEKKRGMIDLPGSIIAEITHTELVFVHNGPSIFKRKYLHIPGCTELPEGIGSITVTEHAVASLRENIRSYPASIGIIDRDKVEGRIAVRFRRDGDRFAPLGVGGSKKITDFLSECSVPRSMRGRLPLVVCGRTIIWVAGMRIHNKYKVTNQTQRVYMFIYKEDGQTDE